MHTIELATSADWPKISEISGRSGYEDYINRIGPSYLESGQVLVWKDEMDIRGFLKLEYLPDNSAWLSGLRVDPDFRRMSIGSELTIAAIESARSTGKKYVRMLIHDGNMKSSGLASKLGFSAVSRFAFFGGIPAGESITSELISPGVWAQYLNLGWVFIRYSYVDSVPARYIRYGRDGIAITVSGHDYQIIVPDEHITLSGEGFTCMEVHGRIPDYLEGLLDRDFDYASVFQKRIEP
ncbi:MAG: GNAT family N-acetyltransferase [Candidatus Thermoplasmatota archaeon]|nr:GNAT family N-acetyltransferase [Candidatus Thermoplasmatota archaeon]